MGLLKPLGGSCAAQLIKYFATAELEKLRRNTQWLSRATDAVRRHWERKNARRSKRRNGRGSLHETIRLNRPNLAQYSLTTPPLGRVNLSPCFRPRLNAAWLTPKHFQKSIWRSETTTWKANKSREITSGGKGAEDFGIWRASPAWSNLSACAIICILQTGERLTLRLKTTRDGDGASTARNRNTPIAGCSMISPSRRPNPFPLRPWSATTSALSRRTSRP